MNFVIQRYLKNGSTFFSIAHIVFKKSAQATMFKKDFTCPPTLGRLRGGNIYLQLTHAYSIS